MALYTDLNDIEQIATDASAINNSIRNILTTRIGSIPGNPTFGSQLDGVLFNQLDHITEDIIVTNITEALNLWEPRVLINNVLVQEVPEYNKLIANINYQYRDKGLNINESISISLMN